MTNSYDPTLGTFASQSSRGNGGVGANGNVTLGGNTLINGDAVTGEGGSIIENGANVVITGDRGSLDEGMTFPPIEPPVVTSSGPLDATADSTIGPGLIGFDEVSAEGGTTLTIEGPAQIVMSSFTLGGGELAGHRQLQRARRDLHRGRLGHQRRLGGPDHQRVRARVPALHRG